MITQYTQSLLNKGVGTIGSKFLDVYIVKLRLSGRSAMAIPMRMPREVNSEKSTLNPDYRTIWVITTCCVVKLTRERLSGRSAMAIPMRMPTGLEEEKSRLDQTKDWRDRSEEAIFNPKRVTAY